MAHARIAGPPRRASARWAACVPLLAALAGCSSDGRRDQNYGKDVGTVYEPPDGGTFTDTAAAPDGAGQRDTVSETPDAASGDGAAADTAQEAGDAPDDGR
jgi:hypothetical protein